MTTATLNRILDLQELAGEDAEYRELYEEYRVLNEELIDLLSDLPTEQQSTILDFLGVTAADEPLLTDGVEIVIDILAVQVDDQLVDLAGAGYLPGNVIEVCGVEHGATSLGAWFPSNTIVAHNHQTASTFFVIFGFFCVYFPGG